MYQFVKEVMVDILNTIEIIQLATVGIPKRMKKNAISISIAFSADILTKNENMISEETKSAGSKFACVLSYKPSKMGG